MNLIDMIKAPLSPLHVEKINQIDAFDFSKTAKKVDRDLNGVTSTYLKDGIENLKRYYVVALLDPLNEHAVSLYVDPFWHAHVLHTKEYIDFCSTIFNQYIHHQPLDPDNIHEVNEVTDLYNYTRKIYQEMFHSVDEEWWPIVNKKSALRGILSPTVCRHMFITNDEICHHALFPVRTGKILQAA